MRKTTINELTLYQSVGVAFNVLVIVVLMNVVTTTVDFVMTATALNVAYVLMSRVVAQKQELVCCATKYGKRSKDAPP